MAFPRKPLEETEVGPGPTGSYLTALTPLGAGGKGTGGQKGSLRAAPVPPREPGVSGASTGQEPVALTSSVSSGK